MNRAGRGCCASVAWQPIFEHVSSRLRFTVILQGWLALGVPLQAERNARNERKENARDEPDGSSHALPIVGAPIAGPPDAGNEMTPHTTQHTSQHNNEDQATEVGVAHGCAKHFLTERRDSDHRE
eukprot:CAMPEP_0183358856 /NCGR_PEP_ID=MMETSP0164_2-20130417/50488_1 /TAXON_ID=221442 /ORGANISM="Coccolithus pelagicus ssp braarudi, Strain PLY182g" /LENGTH=124 /DNA_ID=CAMNT_0025532837 /DNA_START=303 /DNA_END=677 /DNA_ORIENTATION=+